MPTRAAITERIEIPPNTKAYGVVLDVIEQLVIIEFDTLSHTPGSIQGKGIIFKLDIGRQRFTKGQGVIVHLGSHIRYDSKGNILVQGKIGNGVSIELLEHAASKLEHAAFLGKVEKNNKTAEATKLKVEQGKPS